MKRTLKDLGMEDEFANWKKDISNRKYSYNDLRVGSKIEVLQGGLKGRRAEVTEEISRNACRVVFEHTLKDEEIIGSCILSSHHFPDCVRIVKL
jgi:hypothetical protein